LWTLALTALQCSRALAGRAAPNQASGRLHVRRAKNHAQHAAPPAAPAAEQILPDFHVVFCIGHQDSEKSLATVSGETLIACDKRRHENRVSEKSRAVMLRSCNMSGPIRTTTPSSKSMTLPNFRRIVCTEAGR